MLIERIFFRVHFILFTTRYLCLSEKILIAVGVEGLLSGVYFKEEKTP